MYGPMFDVMNKLPVNDSLYCNEYTLTNIETMSGTSVNSKWSFVRTEHLLALYRLFPITKILFKVELVHKLTSCINLMVYNSSK